MYFYKYSKYKPSNTSICENYINPVGIFGNHLSKCPDIGRKRGPISIHRMPPRRSYKVKDYISSAGSPCTCILLYLHTWKIDGEMMKRKSTTDILNPNIKCLFMSILINKKVKLCN